VTLVKDDVEHVLGEPNKAEVEFTWTDKEPKAGKESYYYVRGEQADNELVWVSPMWITYQQSRVGPDCTAIAGPPSSVVGLTQRHGAQRHRGVGVDVETCRSVPPWLCASVSTYEATALRNWLFACGLAL